MHWRIHSLRKIIIKKQHCFGPCLQGWQKNMKYIFIIISTKFSTYGHRQRAVPISPVHDPSDEIDCRRSYNKGYATWEHFNGNEVSTNLCNCAVMRKGSFERSIFFKKKEMGTATKWIRSGMGRQLKVQAGEVARVRNERSLEKNAPSLPPSQLKLHPKSCCLAAFHLCCKG